MSDIKISNDTTIIEESEIETLGLEEIDVSDSTDWKSIIQTELDKIVSKMGLPEKSLYVAANYGRDKSKITSYSVCIYEPDYPNTAGKRTDISKNCIVINITEKKGVLDLKVGNSKFAVLGQPINSTIKELKSDKSFTHILMSTAIPDYVEYIKKNVYYALDHYSSKAGSYGCCSKYIECSKAGKCLHENLLHSKGCSYRKNLENGNIFYS